MNHLKHVKENFGKKIELKTIKTFMGMDCYGVNAKLYIGGKYCAFCLDEGSGGGLFLQKVPKKVKGEYITQNWKLVEELMEFLAPLPQKELDPERINFPDGFLTDYTVEYLVEDLLKEAEVLKQMKKFAKRSICFQDSGNPEDTEERFSSFRTPTTREAIISIWNGMIKGRGRPHKVWYEGHWQDWETLVKEITKGI